MRFSKAGFSLVELTVVLVLVSLIGGLVLPGLSGAYESMLIRDEQERILLRLEGLGYGAFSTGKTIRIESVEDVAEYLAPPEGWEIEVIEPIRVSQSGVCLQGHLLLVKGDFERDLRITPPYCWRKS